MADGRIARLGLLGENADLLGADHEGLLDLIEDYFNDHPTLVKLQLSPLAIILSVVYYEIPLKYTHE